MKLERSDPQVAGLVKQEEMRQAEVLEMIPSENYVSAAVREAVGSVFMNKYAEGYAGKRYYQGNEVVDELEKLACERAKKLFDVPHANVQPLSGAPANLAILQALTQPGDKQLSQHLSTGGHLSMGQEASITSQMASPIYYYLTQEGEVNWQELEEKAVEHKPKIIWSGGTGYTRVFDWERYADVADQAGAYFVADISHIGGLVAGRAHPSPVPYAHIVMTTTHKTLRGPRGAIIMVTDRGLAKDPDLAKKIDRAVFPGIQGGPHMENVAGIAAALLEAAKPAFRQYARQIIKNAQVIAAELVKRDYQLVGGGTENHMVWVDLTNKEIDGWMAAWALEAANIVVNRQTVPGEKGSAYYPSGLRLGTPAVTTRGMKEREMKRIANWIDLVINLVRAADWAEIGSSDRDLDQTARKRFKREIFVDQHILQVKKEVIRLCGMFPVP